jgi:hypothetical protein
MEATEGESRADPIPQSSWNRLGLCHSMIFTLSGLSSLHGFLNRLRVIFIHFASLPVYCMAAV